jgi:hypothetical protein
VERGEQCGDALRPIVYTVETRASVADLPTFEAALSLYREQKANGRAPVIATSARDGFTPEQDDAINRANHDADAEHESGKRWQQRETEQLAAE